MSSGVVFGDLSFGQLVLVLYNSVVDSIQFSYFLSCSMHLVFNNLLLNRLCRQRYTSCFLNELSNQFTLSSSKGRLASLQLRLAFVLARSQSLMDRGNGRWIL